MATNIAKISAAIVALLNSAQLGTFYEKERFTKNTRDMAALYGEEVNGGYIRLSSRKRVNDYDNRHVITLRFQIVYLLVFSDENDSQLTFEDNLELFDDVFMTTDEIEASTQASHRTDDSTGLTVDDTQPVMFAGVLCHRALMNITVEYFE
ncbi:MAG: hypothetical protein COB35_05010 [Gammaproteobacteria bacterium]|nr:MAG: hypothetical protein COB35_05010 [Gammaproteobacteria bacterium]